MALTVTKIGKEISTEKLTYQAVSSGAINPVTSVLLEIYIAPSTTIAHTVEHFPDFGTTDTFTFELNSILKDYFNFSFNALTGGLVSVTENVICGMKFYEVQSGVIAPGPIVQNVVIKNITLDNFEVVGFDFADYDCGDTGSTSSKLLTSAPTTLKVADRTNYFLSALNVSFGGAANSKQEWVIEDYNSSGTLVATTTEDAQFPARGITGVVIDIQKDISNIRLDFDLSGGVVQKKVYIQDQAAPNTVRSETRTFNIYEPCEENITLTWMNEFGVQDTFTFEGNISRSGAYSSMKYVKSRPVNPSSLDVGELVYSSSYNYEYEIFSERIPQSTLIWVVKMMRNNKVAIVFEGNYYPIIITDSDFEESNKDNPITLLRLRFRMANERKGIA